MRLLKLEHKGKYYNNVYESIIKKTYKCMEILYTKKVFKLSENAFTELCLSDRRKLLTFEDMIGKSGDIYSDRGVVSSSYKGINDYLAERFTINGKINYELMFANIINIIEENDDLHNTIIQFFCKLRICQLPTPNAFSVLRWNFSKFKLTSLSASRTTLLLLSHLQMIP